MGQLALELRPDERVKPPPRPRRPRLRLVHSAPVQLSWWTRRSLPLYRGGCEGSGVPASPCPYVSCRHHLYSDDARLEAFAAMLDRATASWPYTCSLAVADAVRAADPGDRLDGVGRVLSRPGVPQDHGALALGDVGRHLGCSAERARQLEAGGMRKLAESDLLTEAYRPDEWWGTDEQWDELGRMVDQSVSPAGGVDLSAMGGAPFEGWSW